MPVWLSVTVPARKTLPGRVGLVNGTVLERHGGVDALSLLQKCKEYTFERKKILFILDDPAMLSLL
jgi:hypothetical protein